MVLNNDLNNIVQQFSEHYHDAWASRKLDNGWVYGDQWSDANKSHPRLKPYSMLNDYVSNCNGCFTVTCNIIFQLLTAKD